MRRNLILIVGFVLSIACAFMAGCGGGGGSQAVLPHTQNTADGVSSSERHLWGLWHVSIDPAANSADIVPLRGVQFTANVNNLLESKPGNLIISEIDTSQYMTEGRLDCTVTLKHPFPGLGQYNGFDVWGVFLHNGTSQLNYDGLTYSGGPNAGPNEAVLLNPDGYTRWFNQPEFDGNGAAILEFFPGKLGNLPLPTATLNPYKAFADGLGTNQDYYAWITSGSNAANRAIFRAGVANSRRYQLDFPLAGGTPKLEFQYAVIASWEPGDPTLTGSPAAYDPGDFPVSANVEEPFLLRIDAGKSDMWNDGTGDKGGSFAADIEVFDWQGGSVGKKGVPNEVYSIIVEGSFLPTGSHKFTQAELASVALPSTENSSVFQVEIPNCTPQASGETSFWVVVEAAGQNGGSYGQGFPTKYPEPARRAAFMQGKVDVLAEAPWPDVVYVDSSNSTGIENGSHQHPWNTIQEGIDNNPSLKEIWVDDSGSDYVECVKMKSSTVLKSVNWDASDGSNRASIKPLTGWDKYGVEFNNVSDARIEGFKIKPGGDEVEEYCEHVMVYILKGSGNIIRDCRFTGSVIDSATGMVYFLSCIRASECSNLTIQNCSFDNLDKGVNEYSLSWWYIIDASNCPGINIRNNVFTVIRPTLDASDKIGWICYLTSCSNAVIKNNLIHHIKPQANNGANLQEGFSLASCANPTVVNNTVDSFDVTVGFFIQQVFAYRFENCTGTITFKNNIATRLFCNGWPPPLARGVLATGSSFVPGFCDMWYIGPGSNGQNYYGVTPDATCISLDPMYVDWQNGNYELNASSPAQMGDPTFVDWNDTGSPSGNPANTDPNTRSRMGCTGGPDGQYVGLLTP